MGDPVYRLQTVFVSVLKLTVKYLHFLGSCSTLEAVFEDSDESVNKLLDGRSVIDNDETSRLLFSIVVESDVNFVDVEWLGTAINRDIGELSTGAPFWLQIRRGNAFANKTGPVVVFVSIVAVDVTTVSVGCGCCCCVIVVDLLLLTVVVVGIGV